MQTAKLTLPAALLCSCLLGACGLRGPLYLPTDETGAKPGPTQNTETTEEGKQAKEGGSES